LRRIVGNLPFLAYVAGGVLMAVYGPQLWAVAPQTAAAAALATTGAFAAAHLILRSGARARRLAALLQCQDDLLRQIVERIDMSDERAEAIERRLDGMPNAAAMDDVKGTLQDLAAMLTARAASAHSPALARAA